MFSLQTLDAKKLWNHHFEAYIRDLDKKKAVIWAGDLNVAPTAIGPSLHPIFCVRYMTSIDLSNPKTNWNKSAGYTEAETTAFANILNPPKDDAGKFVDAWRKLHPDDHHYTYFSYRFNCRAKGIGWRLDMCRWSEQKYAMLILIILYPQSFSASGLWTVSRCARFAARYTVHLTTAQLSLRLLQGLRPEPCYHTKNINRL